MTPLEKTRPGFHWTASRILIVFAGLSLGLGCSADDSTAAMPSSGADTTSSGSASSTESQDASTAATDSTGGADTGAVTSGTTTGGGFDDTDYCEDPFAAVQVLSLDLAWFDECSFWDNDCPAGEKCATWKGVAACAPVDPAPDLPGESCSNYPCGDSCDASSLCAQGGVCRPLCGGNAQDAICAPDTACLASRTTVGSLELIPVCVETCDPLGKLTGCPDADAPCVFSVLGDDFVCRTGEPLLEEFETCTAEAGSSTSSQCPTGSYCGEDAAGSHRCLPLCRLDDVAACEAPQTCTPSFDNPDLSHLGVCQPQR